MLSSLKHVNKLSAQEGVEMEAFVTKGGSASVPMGSMDLTVRKPSAYLDV